jgi:flavin-dependent dehydrogenase
MLCSDGAFSITGTPGLPHQPSSYGPRRTVLDKILVDAASEAGAEVRVGFAVEDVLTEEGRGAVSTDILHRPARVVVTGQTCLMCAPTFP